MAAKAKKMKAEGIPVISFAAGEPDFNTPEPICDAAIQAIRDGFTKYTAGAGTIELREAIVQKLARENGLNARPDQVVVSCGAKHSIYNALMALVEPGDEVILIAPYWMTYAEQIELAGGVPVFVDSARESGFVPDPEAIRAAVTPRTKALVLNSPCNPTGAVFPRSVLKEIAALALRHDFWIISDEIYERLTYGEPAMSVASLGREIAERTVTVNGCSKSYAMTGWRIGYAVAPLEVAQAMANLQDQVTSNPTSFAQVGAVVALGMPGDAVTAMRDEFRARRDLMAGLLAEIPGVEFAIPEGAFYIFASFSRALGLEEADDLALADRLLAEAHVAAVPGSVFRGPGYLRLSYAASQQDIHEGIDRLRSCIQRFHDS